VAAVASYLRAASEIISSSVVHWLTIALRSQVLRYSTLAFGIFYGFYHQRSLTAQLKMNEINREYEHKESMIQQAKAEFTKKTMPPQSKTASGNGMSQVPFTSSVEDAESTSDCASS